MRELWRKRLRRGGTIGGLAVAAFLLAAVIVFVSPIGRGLVISGLLDAIAGDGTARYEAVSGRWPGTLQLSKITIADKEGPWLTVERATLDWRPLALLTGRLHVTRLALDKPVLLRQPKSAEQSSSSGGLSTEPPVAIALDALTVTDGVLRDAAPIRFEGRGTLSWTKRQIALTAHQ